MTAARHQAVLNALDDQRRIAEAAGPGVWRIGRVDTGSATVDAYQDGKFANQVIPPDVDYGPVVNLDDVHHIVAQQPHRTLAQLAGRRRIIERHAPIDYGVMGACCRDPQHAGGAGPSWPCDDYRDAAADLLNMEES